MLTAAAKLTVLPLPISVASRYGARRYQHEPCSRAAELPWQDGTARSSFGSQLARLCFAWPMHASKSNYVRGRMISLDALSACCEALPATSRPPAAQAVYRHIRHSFPAASLSACCRSVSTRAGRLQQPNPAATRVGDVHSTCSLVSRLPPVVID